MQGQQKKILIVLLSLVLFGFITSISIPFVEAAPPKIDLDQCRNGAASSPENCTGSSWVNGNLAATQSHYIEGYSSAYRAKITDAPTGTPITVVLGYDIKHSDKHALDYLTHFNRLLPHTAFGHGAETIDPTSGISGISATIGTFAIPPPSSAGSPVSGQPTTSFNSLPAGERLMTLYGGTISAISYASEGSLAGDQSETQISVTFTLDSSSAVLSWGGHIGRALDWGAGNSAGGISGSPYHMRIISWTAGTNLGNQDRSLSAAAVKVEPVVTTELHKADHSVVSIGGSVDLGTIMHDKVTVTGNSPGGTVTLKFFDNGACSGSPLVTSSALSLSSGMVDATAFAQGPLAADSYSFMASYPGDTGNLAADSICEPFTVDKKQLSISTTVHDASDVDQTNSNVPLGSVMHDLATVSGGVAGFAVPTPSFTLTSSYVVADGCAAGSAVANDGTEGSADKSAASAALGADTYAYRASVAGNDNYIGADSICEPFEVLTPPQGSLIIHKVCLDSTGTPSFGFSVDGGSGPSLACGETSNIIEVDPAVPHSVAENSPLPTGMVFVSAVCKLGDTPVGTPSGTGVNGITVNGGDTVECTFTNMKEKEGLSPGFWKQNSKLWDIIDSTAPTMKFDTATFNGDDPAKTAPYNTNALFNTVFGTSITVKKADGTLSSNPTLLETLGSQRGLVPANGVYDALARHCVASLLNAKHPYVDFAVSEADVILACMNAINTGNTGTTGLPLVLQNLSPGNLVIYLQSQYLGGMDAWGRNE